ncbi:hypothetical protein [Salinifilum ghardaiensis]
MTTLAGFEPVTEVAVDERGRVAVGRALGESSASRFAVSRNEEGQILLTPLVSIPQREKVVWEDEQVKASLLRGMHDAAEGNVSQRDDFIDRNATDDDDEDAQA